jgi:uncharacterized lipoprotein YmbA
MSNRFLLCVVMMMNVFLAFLSGCMLGRSAPSHFYVLNPLTSLEGSWDISMSSSHDVIIGVGPVVFPEYLERHQIVTRTGPNELNFAEFDRWGGSFHSDFLRVLADNLSLLLSTDKVVIYPWVRTTLIEYQVLINVSRFDGTLGEKVELRTRWAVLGDYGRQLYLVKKSNLVEPVEGTDYSALVEAKSRLVAQLSKEIAREMDIMILQNSPR